MGTAIKATGISDINGSGGSVDHAVRAGEACIEKAGIDKSEIDILINTGVYRDHNIVEPAMATLIQKKLGVNADPIQEGANSTFAFDLMNGAGGFLYAAQTAQALIKSGARKMALIVSSDTHPSMEQADDFPFNNCGSALLLGGADNEEKGFTKFIFQTSEKGDYGRRGFLDVAKHHGDGRYNITIKTSDGYIDRLEEFTVDTIQENIKSGELDLSDIDHMITSQPSEDFGSKVAQAIGYTGSCIDVYEEFGNTHSSALCIGYHVAASKGLLAENNKVLFVGASSGLSVALGVYVV